MLYAKPNPTGSKIQFKSRYANYIGGEWTPPAQGNISKTSRP